MKLNKLTMYDRNLLNTQPKVRLHIQRQKNSIHKTPLIVKAEDSCPYPVVAGLHVSKK
jgi:hypothetical protein